MVNLIARYAKWLHTGWPGGTVEKLPEVDENGRTNVPGVYITGDLTGVPLLKFAADSGAAAAQRVAEELTGTPPENEAIDLAIIGGGVSGGSAAMEANRLGLNFRLFEASQSFSTLKNFPAVSPFPPPTDMEPGVSSPIMASKNPWLMILMLNSGQQGSCHSIAVSSASSVSGLLEVRLNDDHGAEVIRPNGSSSPSVKWRIS